MAYQEEPRGEPEWLVAGPSSSGDGRPPWLVAAAIASIAIVGVVLGIRATGDGASSGRVDDTPTSSPTQVREPRPERPWVSGPQSVIEVGHPFLRGGSDWELYGRGDSEVVRLEMAAGRVTRTPVPKLASTGPVSFLTSGPGVIIRPLDHVSGYRVRDTGFVRPLRGVLAQGGSVLPGPLEGEVWVTGSRRGGEQIEMQRVAVRWGVVAREILPADVSSAIEPDGAGSFYFSAAGGTYLREPTGYQRITTGAVLAASRTSWLTAECDAKLRCRHYVINRRTGDRRQIRLLPSNDVSLALASISPNGRYAAVVYRLATQPLTLHLLDLKRGTDKAVPARLDFSMQTGLLSWSPDSAYLAAVTPKGRLVVIDSAAAAATSLRIGLPPLRQLATKSP